MPPAAMLTEMAASRARDGEAPFRTRSPDSVSARGCRMGARRFRRRALRGYAQQRQARRGLSITYLPDAGGAPEQTPGLDARNTGAMRRCATGSPVAYADALNAAFGEIVAELAADLAASVQLPKGADAARSADGCMRAARRSCASRALRATRATFRQRHSRRAGDSRSRRFPRASSTVTSQSRRRS